MEELYEKLNNLYIQYQFELNKNRELITTNENLKNNPNNEKNKNIEIQNQLYKRIDYLKEKLSIYPFELLEGEKIISVIFTSDDLMTKKFIILLFVKILKNL